MTRRRSRRGVALLIVLGMVVLISALAISFHDQMSARLVEAKMGAFDAEALALARSGAALAKQLFKADQRAYTWFHQDEGGGTVAEDSDAGNRADNEILDRVYRLLAATRAEGMPFEEGSLSVDLVDENAKINVNRVDKQVLVNLFTSVGLKRKKRLDIYGEDVEEDISQEVAVSILNWRSPEGQKQAPGALDDYYLGRTPPYKSRSGPFETVEELLLVKDITPLSFHGTEGIEKNETQQLLEKEKAAASGKETPKPVTGLATLVTVYGDARVNINNAPRGVLRVTPGLMENPAREALIQALMERRPFKSPGELSGILSSSGNPALAAAATARAKVKSDVVRVRASGIRGPRRRTVEAVYSRRGNVVRTLFYRED